MGLFYRNKSFHSAEVVLIYCLLASITGDNFADKSSSIKDSKQLLWNSFAYPSILSGVPVTDFSTIPQILRNPTIDYTSLMPSEVGGKYQKNAFFFLPEELDGVYEWPHQANHPTPHVPLCPICPAVEGAFERLKTSLREEKKDVRILKNVTTALTTKVDGLKGTVNTLKGETETLVSDSIILKGQTATLTTDVMGLKGNMDNLNTDVTTLNGKTDSLITDVTALKDQTETLTSDVNTLKGDTTSLTNNVASLEGRTTALEARVAGGVFFAANRVSSTSTVGTITYASPYTSQGDGFDPTTGIFTAPVAGFYSFHFTGFLVGTLQTIRTPGTVALISKGGVVGKASAFIGLVPSQVSFSTVLKLSVGDKVNMALISGELDDSASDKRTHFSGALIERA